MFCIFDLLTKGIFVKLRFILIPIIFFSLGFFGFLLHKKILIIEFAWPNSLQQSSFLPQEQQKKVTLFYVQDKQFESEEVTIMWQLSNVCANSKLLGNNWLGLLFDERVISEPCSVQEVLVNELGTELYISFDRNFLKKAWSIDKKWRVIESLLKTVRQALGQVQAIYFLVNFEGMQDAHLDFTQPWPIEGFCEEA